MSRKKILTKSGFITGLIIFAIVIMFVGFMTAGFSEWTSDDISDNLSAKVNTNNLYNVDECELKDASYTCGITLDVDEKTGALVIDGTATSDKDITVATIELDEGTYNLTAVKGANMNKIYMTAEIGATVEYFDFTEDDANVINISSDNTSVVLKLHIANEAEFNNFKVLPVVVPGEDAESFYK